MSIQIYVEGGGDKRNGDLATDCRRAFSSLIERAIGARVGVTACGGRESAYELFSTAVRTRKHRVAVLLVDSEDPLKCADAWEHLTLRDGWARVDGPAFLMVASTEAWLLADHDALASVFGADFKRNKIPKWPDLEAAPKEALTRALDTSVRACTKGKYGYEKKHCFAVLARVDPKKLAARCPHAKNLFEQLETLVAGGQ